MLGCSSHSCKPVKSFTADDLQFWYSTGGFVSFVWKIRVTRDGQLEYETPRERVLCGRLSQATNESLFMLVDDPRFQRDLDASREGRAESYEEAEIAIEVGKWEGEDSLEGETATPTQRLLTMIERALREAVDQAPPWEEEL